jgi:tetratricopeptide (TPR) repeat protein
VRALWSVALRSARRHVLVIVLAGVFSVVALAGQRSAEAMISADALGLAERLRLHANGIGFYVVKTVWPFGIAPMYDPPADRSTLTVPALVSVLALVAFVALTWRARAKIGHLWIAGVAYFVTLLPVGGIVQVGSQLAADRYAYLPGLMITLAILGCASLWLTRSWTTPVRVAVLTLVCAGLTWRTVQLQAIWGSSKALWLHQLREYSDSPIAHLHLGLLFTEGKDPGATPADAEAHFRAALARSPNYADAWCALGDLLTRSGREQEALAAYDTAVRSEPGHRASWLARAKALWRAGRRDEGLQSLRRLAELSPRDYQPHLSTARALAAAGDARGATEAYERALALGTDSLQPSLWFAWFLATNPDAAARNGARALEIVRAAGAQFGTDDPLWVQAHVAALAETGRFDEAIAILTEVRRSLPPGAAPEIDEWLALFQARQALRIEPTFP